MSNDYSREVLRRVVAQVCQIIGWQGINSTPLDILVHILEKYILTLCTQTHRYAEQFNRTEATLHDLGLVFRDIHIPLQELREYTRCVPPVACQLNVPPFPLAKESRLNFLKPGSQEVLTRPMHVQEYLPAMHPEREREPSPPPPVAGTVEITNGGEPNNCKSPDISVTDLPKDVFKRPGDPVSTPPGLKRPRLKLEDEDCHTREISSVMMTMSGFLSPAREGKLPEARTPAIVHDGHPEKVKTVAPPPAPHPAHPAAPHPAHPTHPPHRIPRSEKKSKKNKALNGKIDKSKRKDKAHKIISMGKQKNSENKNNKLAMHLARGKVRPSGSVKHHVNEMPPLKRLVPPFDSNNKPIKQEIMDRPTKMPMLPFDPMSVPPPLVQIQKNSHAPFHHPHNASEAPLLPHNITIKEEKVEHEKLTSQPDRSKLNIFKKISTKSKEERMSDSHDRFIHDNGAIKIEKSSSRCNSPSLVIDDPDVSRQKMAHIKESIDYVVSNSAVDLTSKKSLPSNEVISIDDDFNEIRKRVIKQEVSDDIPKDLSKPKLNAVHNLPPSPIIKEKKERKRRERKPKPDKALRDYTKMLKKQQLEKMRNMDAHLDPKMFSSGLPHFPGLFPRRNLIGGAGLIPAPGLIPGGGLLSGLPNTLRALLPPESPNMLPNPFSMGAGGSGFNHADFLSSTPGLIPPNLTNPLLSHLSHSFGKPPQMPQHPNLPPFLRRPSLEVIPIDDDNQTSKKGKQLYVSPPLVKEKEKREKSRISPDRNMILNNINMMRTSPIKQSPPKPNPIIKMPVVKPDITIKLNPPEKPKLDIPKQDPVPIEEPVLPTKEKEKDKSERKKDKLHKKEKKDKELKIKKKKDKKDKIKIRIEKKKEKEERHDMKEKSKKEKKEKRKDKEKIPSLMEGLVPKLTLKLGPASPLLPPSPDTTRKLNIKPVVRKDEQTSSYMEPLPTEDRLSAERSVSPKLARISALVTRPPKSKPSHKHSTPSAKSEPNPQLNISLSPPPQPSNSSPTRKNRPPSTFSKYKRIYFKPIPKRNNFDDSAIDLDQDDLVPLPPKDVSIPEKFPNVPLGTPFYMDPQGNKVWICPACGQPDNGSPMIGCDGGCDGWYHWVCVGIRIAPNDNEDWYCTACIAKRTAMVSAMAAGQTGKKRGRKPKAEKLKEIQLG